MEERSPETTHRVRIIVRMDADAVEEEANALRTPAAALAEGVHQLLQLGGALDLEEDLVVVVGHLDVEVLHRRRGVVGASAVVGGVVRGHGWLYRVGAGEAEGGSQSEWGEAGRRRWLMTDEMDERRLLATQEEGQRGGIVGKRSLTSSERRMRKRFTATGVWSCTRISVGARDDRDDLGRDARGCEAEDG